MDYLSYKGNGKKQMKEIKKQIDIAAIRLGTITVPIKGKTPLLMDKFPEEAKQQILAKQTGVSKSNKKKVRDIKEETLSAIHITSKGQIGFPASGFKAGMIEATSFVGDKSFSKKLISGLRIINSQEGLIPIKFKKQDVLEHNIGSVTKFTPQFHDWKCEITFQFDQNNISEQDITTLLNYAGFYNGIGAWRPKGKDGGTGEFGMYEVAQS